MTGFTISIDPLFHALQGMVYMPEDLSFTFQEPDRILQIIVIRAYVGWVVGKARAIVSFRQACKI